MVSTLSSVAFSSASGDCTKVRRLRGRRLVTVPPIAVCCTNNIRSAMNGTCSVVITGFVNFLDRCESYDLSRQVYIVIKFIKATNIRARDIRRSPLASCQCRSRYTLRHSLRRKNSEPSAGLRRSGQNSHLEIGRPIRYSDHMSIYCAIAAFSHHPRGEPRTPSSANQ